MAQLAEMISSLEQAVLMAKQIGTTVEENHLQQIWSSLDNAHHRLSAFLISTGAEKSLSSAAVPMQLGEEEKEVEKEVEKVEERMRECFIKRKKRKRRLSPSSAAAETSSTEEGSPEISSPVDYEFEFEFDPHATKLRALDLLYQFHG